MARQLKVLRLQARAENLEQELKRKRVGRGTSGAARRRFLERTRGKVHAGRPGDVIEMSRGARYHVAADGSFRRLKVA